MGFRTQIIRIRQIYTDILPMMSLAINSILIRDNPLNPLNPCSFFYFDTPSTPKGGGSMKNPEDRGGGT